MESDQRQHAKENAQRVAAGLAGAVEGFVEETERQDLTQKSKQSIQEASRLAREAGSEVQAQARSPEMQELREDTRRAVEKTTARVEESDLAASVVEAKDTVVEKAQQAAATTREEVDRAQVRFRAGVEETKARASEVAESGQRAKQVPGHILEDLKAARKAWTGGMAAGLGMYAGAGALGVAAFVVLTIGLVGGLAVFIGLPLAAIAIAVLYAIGAGGAVAGAKKAQQRGREKAEKQVEDARKEVRYVARPLRRAFGRAPVREGPFLRPRTRKGAPKRPLRQAKIPEAGREPPPAAGEEERSIEENKERPDPPQSYER